MTRRQSIYTLASVYIGTVIGAGFASGQEIFQFFGKYGWQGILGVIIVTILFSLLGVLVLNSIYTKKIKSFKQFSTGYFGKAFFTIINILLTFLLFTSYVVMLSGSGAVFYEHFQIQYIYGIIIMAIITFFVFIFGVRGIANANKVIVPFLVFIILWIGLNVIYKNQMVFSNFYTAPFKSNNIFSDVSSLKYILVQLIHKSNWLWSAIVYFCYNTIGSIVVMCSLYPLIYDKKAAKLGGLLGGLVLGILAMIILLSLMVLYTSVIGLEVPMVTVASTLGDLWKTLYSFVLLLAMFTTAIANGYGCILGIANLTRINEKFISIIVCVISVPLAMVGFKKLVTFFYPLFGYIGMLFICAIILKRRKSYRGFL
ncbi:hypothetical protein KQI88_07795 [Alkaliphilus sp. MSJ-5]|uniref:Transporter n=1 Tax=Alkaliphilus flagellatus TaxID=2841507 RepID=A0ABS6G2B4_9FIRM|nr:hypothetical protein [Alkaliphilus flagellatus]MBU5676316.1 hypothetical protein [Alkaliphilus flagellatus]